MAYAILAGLVVWLIWRRFGRLTDRAERLESRVEYLEARVKLLAGPAPAHVIETPPPVETLVPRPRAPAPAPEPAAPPPPPPPLPHKAAPQARRSLTEALKSRVDVADWETVIGGRWLNKIGIVVLVVGVALFLGYSLRYMGPWGRVATGGFSALTLLIGGLFLQRIKKYALFAKPLVGGGWALLYFTAYAAHNVAAAKVIVAPLGGLALLGAVAAGSPRGSRISSAL
jgi:uncharacterized membrane protein